MSFVDDHVLPTDLAQDALLLQHVVVGREQHVELATSNLVLHLLARVFVALVDDLDHMRRPLVQLQVPVGNRPLTNALIWGCPQLRTYNYKNGAGERRKLSRSSARITRFLAFLAIAEFAFHELSVRI